MKQKLLTIMAVGIVAFGLGGTLGWAENSSWGNYNIPFEFYVGDSMLPAGNYDVNLDYTSQVVPRIKNTDGSKGVFANFHYRINVNDKNDVSSSTLIFKKLGDRTYLTEIRVPRKGSFRLWDVKDSHTHMLMEKN